MESSSSSCSSSSWVKEEEHENSVASSVITFKLPATDSELVNQVFDFICMTKKIPTYANVHPSSHYTK